MEQIALNSYINTNKLPADYPLKRGLDKDGLMKSLGIDNKPTFLFRLTEYYKNLENGDPRKDTHENTKVNYINSIPTYDKNCNPIYISCWSIAHHYNIFLRFQDTIGIIESSIKDITTIINTIIITKLRSDIIQLTKLPYPDPIMINDHGCITYYDKCNKPQNAHWYCKERSFSFEEEYRFALILRGCSDILRDNLIIPIDNVSYIKKIYIKKGTLFQHELQHINSLHPSLPIELLHLK